MSYHRIAILAPLCALLTVGLAHAGAIQYQITSVVQADEAGGSAAALQCYIYYASGLTFLENQELDVVFDADLYGTLSNAVSSPGFDVMLFQPNNPPGVPGDFSALALFDIGSAAGPWSVDFLYTGPDTPGPQTYYINQYDANGNFIETLESGTTLEAPDQGVPEPGTFALVGLVVAGRIVWSALRRRSASTAH
jgi:hypothetical protein